MTTKDFVGLVCDRIGEGKLDKYLEAIMAECNERRRVVHQQKVRRNMRELNTLGGKVRITGGIRPKYLIGYEGTVVSRPPEFRVKDDLIYVDLGEMIGTGRRKFGPVVGVPAGALEGA